MQKSTKFNRRSFLYGQIAFATTIGLCGTVASATQQASSLWLNGTAEDFAEFINQPFTIKGPDGDFHNLTLSEVEAVNSGSDRPTNLPRSEGVVLNFKGDFTDSLVEKGHHSVWIFNSNLGETSVLLGTVPRKSGGYDIEVVLN